MTASERKHQTSGSALPQTPRETRKTAQVGDVWQDQDGHLLRVVHVEKSSWFWVKPHRSPKASSIYTNPAWLTRWTLTEFGK